MNRLLINEPPLQVLPKLAVAIGLNEALFLQWLGELHGVPPNEKVFPFWSNRTIKRIIKSLFDQGLIVSEIKGMSPDDAVKILKGKSPQKLREGDEKCTWCSCITLSLQRHHYPFPRRLGGTDTVLICANCHYEYHALVDRSQYSLTQKGETLLRKVNNDQP